MSRLFVGTSNVVMPGNKHSFPEAFQQGSRLHYYSTLFNSVEINSSFYKIPMRSTFEKWTLDTTDDFRFTIKLNREISHSRDLNYDQVWIDRFMSAATGLGGKKGCLLLQFPGKITIDHFQQVEMILEQVSQMDTDNAWKKAVEFRHPSWYIGETYELMNEFNSSIVLHDHPRARIIDLDLEAGFVYLRFHGPSGNYRDSYDEAVLKEKAVLISGWMDAGKDVYVYFNNTIGDAYLNAQYLRSLFI